MRKKITAFPDVLTREEVSRLLGVSHDTLRVWNKKGILRWIKLSAGTVRYTNTQIKNYIKKYETIRHSTKIIRGLRTTKKQ